MDEPECWGMGVLRVRGLRERVRAGGGELMADLTTQRVIPPDKTLSVLLTYRLLQKGRGGGREPSLRW